MSKELKELTTHGKSRHQRRGTKIKKHKVRAAGNRTEMFAIWEL